MVAIGVPQHVRASDVSRVLTDGRSRPDRRIDVALHRVRPVLLLTAASAPDSAIRSVNSIAEGVPERAGTPPADVVPNAGYAMQLNTEDCQPDSGQPDLPRRW